MGLTYRFAPNVTFDMAGAVLVTGDAYNYQRAAPFDCVTGGVQTCQARNVYKLASRIRVTF